MIIYGPWFSVLCAACLAALGLFAWRHRVQRGAGPLGLLAFSLAAFLVLSVLRPLIETAQLLALVVLARSVAGALAAVQTLEFTLELAGRSVLARRLRLPLLLWPLWHALVLLVVLLLHGMDTGNPAHPLRATGAGGVTIDRISGMGSVLLVTTAFGVMLLHVLRCHGRARLQAGWLLLALLVGAVGPTFDAVVLQQGLGLLSPASWLLECGVFTYAIHRFGVLGALPVAYAQVFREIELGVVVTDTEGYLREANHRALQWLELPRGRLRERRFETLGERAARVAAIAPGQHGVAMAWLVEGRQTAFEISRIGIEFGYGVGTDHLFIIADVSARKRAEQLLQENTRELDRLVDEQTAELARMTADLAAGNAEIARTSRLLAEAQRLARIGSWAWQREDGQVRASPELQHLLGRAEVVADFDLEAFIACLHPDDVALVRGRSFDVGAFEGQEPLLVRAPRRDGSLRWLSMHPSRALERGASGEVLVAVGTVQDVSEERETALRLAQRGEELERRVGARSRELLALSRDQDDVNRLAFEALAPAFDRIECLLGELRERESAAPAEAEAALRRIGAALARMRGVAREARELADTAARQLRDP